MTTSPYFRFVPLFQGRTDKFVIKKEREKDKNGNYIIDKKNGEIKFEKDNKSDNYILTKQYKRKTENAN